MGALGYDVCSEGRGESPGRGGMYVVINFSPTEYEGLKSRTDYNLSDYLIIELPATGEMTRVDICQSV